MKQILFLGFLLIFIHTSAQSITFCLKDQYGKFLKESGIKVRYSDSSYTKFTDANGNLTIPGLKPLQTISLYGYECSLTYTVPATMPENPVELQLQAQISLDEPAVFPGGQSALMRFMAENLHYPQQAIEREIEGKVYASFVIDATGKITNIKVTRSIPDCPECDAEAIRLLESMPLWIPGKKGGKPFASFFSLPIPFKLQ